MRRLPKGSLRRKAEKLATRAKYLGKLIRPNATEVSAMPHTRSDYCSSPETCLLGGSLSVYLPTENDSLYNGTTASSYGLCLSYNSEDHDVVDAIARKSCEEPLDVLDRGIAILIEAANGKAPGPDLQKHIHSVRASICPYRCLLYFREM
jgi:hypothetical protein